MTGTTEQQLRFIRIKVDASTLTGELQTPRYVLIPIKDIRAYDEATGIVHMYNGDVYFVTAEDRGALLRTYRQEVSRELLEVIQ